MADDVSLIIQLPAGGTVDRQLAEDPPPSVASGRTVLERVPGDADGRIEPPESGEVLLSFLSPESLRREAEQVGQEIRRAESSATPVVVIEVAEELREDELAVLLQAAEEAGRTVILCILGSTAPLSPVMMTLASGRKPAIAQRRLRRGVAAGRAKLLRTPGGIAAGPYRLFHRAARPRWLR